MINVKFAETNELFKTACELAGVKPTQRQASKYRLGKGLAFSKKIEAKSYMEKEEKKNE